MVAVDTSVLVCAHRAEMPEHPLALTALRELAEGPAPWALPVFVISEFLEIATHLRVLEPPSDERQGLAVIDRLLASPTVQLLTPGPRYWELLSEDVRSHGVRGGQVHGAALLALCREWGVTEILSEDPELARHRGMKILRLAAAAG